MLFQKHLRFWSILSYVLAETLTFVRKIQTVEVSDTELV